MPEPFLTINFGGAHATRFSPFPFFTFPTSVGGKWKPFLTKSISFFTLSTAVRGICKTVFHHVGFVFHRQDVGPVTFITVTAASSGEKRGDILDGAKNSVFRE